MFSEDECVEITNEILNTKRGQDSKNKIFNKYVGKPLTPYWNKELEKDLNEIKKNELIDWVSFKRDVFIEYLKSELYIQ